MTHCKFCGKRLTNPDSIARSAGPVCSPRGKVERVRVRKPRRPRGKKAGQLELFEARG